MSKDKSDIESLFDQLKPFKQQPIDSWHPDRQVEIDIRIDAQGIWHYQGSPITRHRIAKLFSTLLRKERESYFLVTPPVKYRVRVDDVPFTAVQLQHTGTGVSQKLYLKTNMDEVVLIDGDHPLTLETGNYASSDQIPYVEIRSGLKARVVRSVYYQLADLVQSAVPKNGVAELGVYSAGVFFQLGRSE